MYRSFEYQKSTLKLLNQLHKFDLTYLVLSSLSSHAQYPSGSLEKYKQDPYKIVDQSIDASYLNTKANMLRDYQASALTHGFCHLNSKTMVVCHIATTRLDLL